jgi:hypothetical protein
MHLHVLVRKSVVQRNTHLGNNERWRAQFSANDKNVHVDEQPYTAHGTMISDSGVAFAVFQMDRVLPPTAVLRRHQPGE